MKQGGISNQSVYDIEKPWKDKVVALEKVNEVLRVEINELQQEAQSTTEILNQAKIKLQECKANEINLQKVMNVKISDFKKELDRLKAVKSELEETVKEIENKYTEQSELHSSSMLKNKELEQKISEQQKIIDSLKQTCKFKQSANVAQGQRLQTYLNALKKEEDKNSDLETKLVDKTKALEQSKKETASFKGNITKIKNKNKESEEIIQRIWDQIKNEGFIHFFVHHKNHYMYFKKIFFKKATTRIILNGKK